MLISAIWTIPSAIAKIFPRDTIIWPTFEMLITFEKNTTFQMCTSSARHQMMVFVKFIQANFADNVTSWMILVAWYLFWLTTSEWSMCIKYCYELMFIWIISTIWNQIIQQCVIRFCTWLAFECFTSVHSIWIFLNICCHFGQKGVAMPFMRFVIQRRTFTHQFGETAHSMAMKILERALFISISCIKAVIVFIQHWDWRNIHRIGALVHIAKMFDII